MMNLYNKEALLTAVHIAKKPIAFLVGSPISNENGKGVPGIAGMLDFVRQEVEKLAPQTLALYDAAVAGKTGSDAYQSAMSWVQGFLLQDTVNDIVAKAVLNARKPRSTPEFREDGIPEDWDIPTGVHQLTWLVCQNREQFPGPILTTNFDPLISLAISSNGGIPVIKPMLSDGSLPANFNQGQIEVVHLHGFWRASDTMHTPAQLVAPRPKLKEALKSILHKHTLLIVAYSGWDDVFTQALNEAVQDGASDINVLWCFRSNNLDEIRRDYSSLIQKINPLLISGRFNAYGGIDCHHIFNEISAAAPSVVVPNAAAPNVVVPNAAPSVVVPNAAITDITVSTSQDNHVIEPSPLLGWQLLSDNYLNKLAPLNKDDIIRYFDGAVPTLRHALSHEIPHREATKEISLILKKILTENKSCSMQLIRAAGGEGKTTVLLQAAVEAALSGKWSVLWRNSSLEGLSSSAIEKLDKTKKWLIVADDADNLVAELAEAAKLINDSGLSNIHFLIAARDVDWRNAYGDRQGWDRWLIKFEDSVLNRITSDDAKTIVRAWGKFGKDGLRELTSAGNLLQKAYKLLKAVWDEDEEKINKGNNSGDGSFFGGLLKIRFGQGGLRAHVLGFLEHLKGVTIQESSNESTLLDALYYISACHGTNITGLDERILADLVGVPRDWVQSKVVKPLGAEIGAVDTGGQVFTRHSKVAAEIIVEGERSLNADFAEIWARLIRQTYETGLDPYLNIKNSDCYFQILNAGSKLQDSLPNTLLISRRKFIAIAAAKADVAVEPERLSAIISLGKTCRIAVRPAEAVEVFRDAFKDAETKADYGERIRSFVTEWSMLEGQLGQGQGHKYTFISVWLTAIAFSDVLNPAPITSKDIKMISTSLGAVFVRLLGIDENSVYAKAVRGINYIGRLVEPDSKALSYFERNDNAINDLGVGYPVDVNEAVEWMANGVAQARLKVYDSMFTSISNSSTLSFNHLKTTVTTAS